MTFQVDIKKLQNQIEIVKAPIYSFKDELLDAQLMLNDAIKHAEAGIKKKYEEFRPLLDRGNSLQSDLTALWNHVKDLPNIEGDINDIDPESELRKIYKNTDSIQRACQVLVHEVCSQGMFRDNLSAFQSQNNANRDLSGKRFSKKELQKAIDAVRKTGKTVTKGRVMEKLKKKIKDVRIFNKYLRELNISDDDFYLAAKDEPHLK